VGAVQFDTTRWTLIAALGDEGPDRDRALGDLARLYWRPVYAWLRRSGNDAEQAAETTQAFFTDVVIGRRLFERADRAEGRLRTLLLRALKRFQIDGHRRRTARPDGFAISAADLVQEEASIEDAYVEPSTAFDRRWAGAALEESLRRCADHFRQSGREGHWTAFERHVLQPATSMTGPAPYRVLAEELGFGSPAEVASAVQVVRRRVQDLLAEVVGETARSPDEAANELHLVKQLLS